MKKQLILLGIVVLFLFSGCATMKVTTGIGTMIGETYQECAAQGTISAEQSIVAWPYISGQIKGLLAGNYNIDLSRMATDIIDQLDVLAAKETLTTEEKGFVIGSFVRLEVIAIEDGWNQYGISILNLLVKTITK